MEAEKCKMYAFIMTEIFEELEKFHKKYWKEKEKLFAFIEDDFKELIEGIRNNQKLKYTRELFRHVSKNLHLVNERIGLPELGKIIEHFGQVWVRYQHDKEKEEKT